MQLELKGCLQGNKNHCNVKWKCLVYLQGKVLALCFLTLLLIAQYLKV